MTEVTVAAPWVSHDESTSFDSHSLKAGDTLPSAKAELRDVGETVDSVTPTSEFQNNEFMPPLTEQNPTLKITQAPVNIDRQPPQLIRETIKIAPTRATQSTFVQPELWH